MAAHRVADGGENERHAQPRQRVERGPGRWEGRVACAGPAPRPGSEAVGGAKGGTKVKPAKMRNGAKGGGYREPVVTRRSWRIVGLRVGRRIRRRGRTAPPPRAGARRVATAVCRPGDEDYRPGGDGVVAHEAVISKLATAEDEARVGGVTTVIGGCDAADSRNRIKR